MVINNTVLVVNQMVESVDLRMRVNGNRTEMAAILRTQVAKLAPLNASPVSDPVIKETVRVLLCIAADAIHAAENIQNICRAVDHLAGR